MGAAIWTFGLSHASFYHPSGRADKTDEWSASGVKQLGNKRSIIWQRNVLESKRKRKAYGEKSPFKNIERTFNDFERLFKTFERTFRTFE